MFVVTIATRSQSKQTAMLYYRYWQLSNTSNCWQVQKLNTYKF